MDRNILLQSVENIKNQIKLKLSEHNMTVKEVISWDLDKNIDGRIRMMFKDYSGLFVDISGINEYSLIQNYFHLIIQELMNEGN